jgi:hypothetical protein
VIRIIYTDACTHVSHDERGPGIGFRGTLRGPRAQRHRQTRRPGGWSQQRVTRQSSMQICNARRYAGRSPRRRRPVRAAGCPSTYANHPWPPPPPPRGGRPSSLLVSLPRQDATASLASPPTRRRWLCSLHIAVHLSQPHRTHPRPTRERDRSVGQDAGRRREATARACRARDSQAWPILYPRRLRDPCHILLRGHVVVYYFAAFARAALALWPDRSTPKTGVVGPAGAVTNGVSILAKQRSRLDVARRLYYVTEAAAFSCDAMPFFHGL